MSVEIAFAIKTGIVSGIVTAILLWVIRQLWLYVFSPKLAQYFYNSVLIDGTWNATIIEEDLLELNGTKHKRQRELTLSLNQRGSKISGTFYAKSERKKESNTEKEKKEYSNQYKINGYVSDNYVTLNYKALSRNRTGLGSLVLSITHGGTKMQGGMNFMGEGTEKISTIEDIEFERSL